METELATYSTAPQQVKPLWLCSLRKLPSVLESFGSGTKAGAFLRALVPVSRLAYNLRSQGLGACETWALGCSLVALDTKILS